ncbi:MAG TPA: phage integrase SAM-like domain-containing protein, partial [Pirellulales bacterium]
MSDAEIKVHLVEIAGRNIALRWIDPKSGKWRQKSARTRVVREAERAAARLEKELAAGISPAGRLPTWDEFCERYEDVKLPSAAKNTGDLWRTVANSIEEFDAEQTELARMKRLVDLTADRLEKWHKWLRDKPVAEATIASYTRTLLAALKWGVGKAMLAVVPKIELPERNTRKGRKMRGKALSQDEFARMLAAVPRVVPAADVDEWKRLLEGMWLSGLRISEALELSWDEGERLSV